MLKPIGVLSVVGLLSTTALAATDGEMQADSFIQVYSLCMQNVKDFNALRDKLHQQNLPKFEPEQAQALLGGQAGDAWPVPIKQEQFVLGLLKDKDVCLAGALKADPERVNTLFSQLVGQPAPPFVVKQRDNPSESLAGQGSIHKLSYEWSVPNSPKKSCLC